MITERFCVEAPPYILIEGKGVNPDYRKVKAEFETRFHVRYQDRRIDNWSLDDGTVVSLNLENAFIIMTNKGPANRRIIIVADSKDKMSKAKSELENLFDGEPKLNLRELSRR